MTAVNLKPRNHAGATATRMGILFAVLSFFFMILAGMGQMNLLLFLVFGVLSLASFAAGFGQRVLAALEDRK